MTQEIAKITGALAIQSDQKTWDSAQLAALTQLGVKDATDGDLAVYLNYCQQTGMSPFAKQIYMIARKEGQGANQIIKQTIQMGIDGFRIIAQRSNEYQGQTKAEWCGPDGVWKTEWLKNEPPLAARIGIHRKGFLEPLYATALWSSYAQTYQDGNPTTMWKKHGPGQLLKCAEALALRKAFPMDLSGIYEPAEMESMDNEQAYQPVKNEPVMTKSEPVEQAVISWTDDEMNAASLAFDNIEQFNDRVSLKAWSESPAIVPMLFIPVNSKGLTIHQGVLDRAFYLKEQEAKNGK